MTQGQLFKSKRHGLLRFERWDTYFGETTAEFVMLDDHERKTWYKPDQLSELEPLFR